jgi:hypothetical protein
MNVTTNIFTNIISFMFKIDYDEGFSLKAAEFCLYVYSSFM